MQRIVAVTGSSRGIGRLVAEKMIGNGNIVVGCSRGPSEFEHDRYHHFVLDLADEVRVRAMIQSIGSAHGRLDLLVNSAGVASTGMGLLTSAESFSAVVATNLVGAFVVMREAIRLMKRSRFGRIVNFSSINVPLSSLGAASYNASKAALENLCMSLSRECATDDITINCVGLSLVAASGMVANLSPQALEHKQRSLIKPTLLEIAEVMHAIDFFADPNARNVTGQVLYFGGVR